jgi:hypothetical protein
MMRHDGEGQQQRCRQRAAHVFATHRDRHRGNAERNAQRHRHDDEIGRPRNAARHLEGKHAGIVHAGDAAADDGAAGRRRQPLRPEHRKAQSAAGDDRGGNEREGSEADVVSRRDARPIGQHGDEVRRPDAAAGSGTGDDQPRRPCPSGGDARPMKQADGSEARQETDDPGKHDQTPVVLAGEASQNAEHANSRCVSNPRINTYLDPVSLALIRYRLSLWGRADVQLCGGGADRAN